MERKKKITIQDVARYANVSVGTIDRVIHNRGKVSDDKKQKVEEAITALDFNPNLLARTLALGGSFNICVLIPAIPYSGHYWSIPIEGIKIASKMYMDFGIVIDFCFYDQSKESSFVEQTKRILELDPEGVIIAPIFQQECNLFLDKLKGKNIPYVFIDIDIPNQENLSYIGPDIKRSAYIAGKLLNSIVDRNSQIIILNLIKGIENPSVLNRMEMGFKDFFDKNGLHSEIELETINIYSNNKETVFQELTKFYIKNPNISGVFVTSSDAHLISDFHLKHELDIRVVGFDLVDKNIEQLKKGGIDYIISQSPKQQGIKAVQTLFELFVYKKEPQKTQHVPLDIIIKENVDFYIDFY